eukprot:TRINITY_DN728_c0_g1_i1.p1 TRINITY_DN728_c0_g1~~TRINITY_DN728_c0_g1_i1.p1  ORF type:complete len:431 (+),score=77.90 TRINITY_DN728_c0_g1_i1:96-1388(+)
MAEPDICSEFLSLPYPALQASREQRRAEIDLVPTDKEVGASDILQDLQYTRELYEDGILMLNSLRSPAEIVEVVQQGIKLLLKGLTRQIELQERLLLPDQERTNNSEVEPMKVLKQELYECSEQKESEEQIKRELEAYVYKKDEEIKTNEDNSMSGDLDDLNDNIATDNNDQPFEDPSGEGEESTGGLYPSIKLENSESHDEEEGDIIETTESKKGKQDAKPKKKRNRKKGPVIPCEKCDRVFSCKSLWLEHMRRHLGEKPFKCDQCFKDFLTKGNLKEHMKIHSGERNFQCSVCTKKCIRKIDLERHMLTHTGEKPYKCEFCFMDFTTNSNLVKHVRTHTGEKPYSCDICHRSFTSKAGMVEHKRGHTGDKPFTCHLCQKSFSRTKHLQRHLRMHSGIKPFQCEICEKSFTRRENLKGHMNTHSRVKAE